ncbi:NADPH-dependent FMN reductase [Moheibacter sediminis]|uniref:NAD(P)H-dependent FMN reductase n=1 Tax=Moheibacter sediminis TaxID=1434700 RepID=A0A1W1Y6X1_9FLAO|nr:NAD(P)H-dependent oxidoreductase [Moheibacter sediminis]SMC31916.1 NAD(P)H-dependent FMN reductase [Moheibacter sediminis]
MKKILAFTGSNHSKSINRQLLQFALELIDKRSFEITEIDLRDYSPVMLSLDEEKQNGLPAETQKLHELMHNFDGYIIASPEHNSSVPAFLKNITDWLSRKELKFFNEKPVLLLSTSQGGRGGKTNLAVLESVYSRMFSAKITGTFSLPSFSQNFQDGKIVNDEELNLLKEEISNFSDSF